MASLRKGDKLSLFGTKTIYFIDSENVNDNWIENITEFKKSDEIRVFYTEKSTNVSWENISKIAGGDVSLNWIKCFTGQNALDFQLVTDLGYSVAKGMRDTFVIISNDKGYDAVVNYWVIKGVNVSRVGVETKTAKKPKKPVKSPTRSIKSAVRPKAVRKVNPTSKTTTPTKAKTKKPTATTNKTATNKTSTNKASTNKTEVKKTEPRPKTLWSSAPKSDDEYVRSIGRVVSVKELNRYHMILTNLFGQEIGTVYYHKLKEDKNLKGEIAKTYISQKTLRLDYLVRLFLAYNNKDEVDPNDILKILRSKKCDSLNSFYRLLTEKFKEEKGREYYNIFKGIYSILKDI